MERILLASASPRRRDILKMLGVPFDLRPTDAPEDLPPQTLPADGVAELSRRKAMAVPDSRRLILAADTMVALDGLLFGKPRDDREAAEMLTALSGRTHSVFTGVTLRRGGEIVTGVAETRVTFRALTEEEIASYVASGDSRGKAGAYGIQGRGSLLAASIEGDYFNVVGLPVALLVELFARFGITVPQILSSGEETL